MGRDDPDLIRRFMTANTKAVVGAVKDPQGAVDAMLKANPKAGKRDTLLEGFEQTTQFYADGGKSPHPFQINDQTMTDTVSNMVEYGGLEAVAKKDPKAYYINDFLPK